MGTAPTAPATTADVDRLLIAVPPRSEAYDLVLERCGDDPAPALRHVAGRVREALAELVDDPDNDRRNRRR